MTRIEAKEKVFLLQQTQQPQQQNDSTAQMFMQLLGLVLASRQNQNQQQNPKFNSKKEALDWYCSQIEGQKEVL